MFLVDLVIWVISLPLLILKKIAHQWHNFRSYLYDVIIVSMTQRWYRAFLTQVSPNSVVLDVGMGTATSLIANRDLLVSKNIRVHGVDYDQGYITAANKAIIQFGLENYITTECASIHDFSEMKERVRVDGKKDSSTKPPQGPFHHIYFSGSFMIIPEKVKALQRVSKMLLPKGKVFFSQTFENPGFVGKFMGLIKPLFKFILTIDFGQVTFEPDFRAVVALAGLQIEDLAIVGKSRWRREVLVTASMGTVNSK